MRLAVWIGAITVTLAQATFAQTPPSCACGGTLVSKPALLLAGKTLCAARGGESWQEYHAANFDLIDWKRGAGNPVDPTTKVGVWSATATTVTHSYGPGNAYTWQMCKEAGSASNPTYSFCDGPNGANRAVQGATIKAGQVPC